jgi:hypothetical protein
MRSPKTGGVIESLKKRVRGGRDSTVTYQGVKNHYLRMMLGGHEEEDEAVKELDAVHAGDAHVKEHAEEDREGDEFEYGGKHH